MTKGIMVRNKKGQFVKGESGNPVGRPKGSKNVITVQKLMVEEAFREASAVNIGKVLEMVVTQALEGDKASQKLIWDAAVSKQTIEADKASGNKQNITVKTMNVSKDVIEGDFNVEEDTTEEETLQ